MLRPQLKLRLVDTVRPRGLSDRTAQVYYSCGANSFVRHADADPTELGTEAIRAWLLHRPASSQDRGARPGIAEADRPLEVTRTILEIHRTPSPPRVPPNSGKPGLWGARGARRPARGRAELDR